MSCCCCVRPGCELLEVSEELSETVSIVPVTQGLTSSSPAATIVPHLTTFDPWHVHLDLHRRSCPGITVQLPVFPTETNNINSSSRRSWSSSPSESRDRKLSVDSTSDSLCSSFREDKRFHMHAVAGSRVDLVQVPVTRSREDLPDHLAPASMTSSDESPSPVACLPCSPCSSTTNLHEDLQKNLSTGGKIICSPTCRGPRKLSAPALQFTRQLSVGGAGSSSWVHLNHNHYPFPNRKRPRISEAARRLGMYSSF
ncbi:uncharacterized protein LOC118098277 isoform X2 [Hippoglossus stenolepis]|uniref:uncharacterized protein LOC118098277 isoform X2 n=1 Tax=Hippoglossus stenolepis TaxID=195615 RepID=UPI001FB010AF|nr:uncharacterized protein LOC118098277 isoform X2 [Hippoglossus stenolepis]